VGEVEARVKAERHDRGRGARGAHTGRTGEDASFGVEAQRAVGDGEREDLGQVLAFDEVVEFAGNGAGVGFEGGQKEEVDWSHWV